VEEEGTKRTFDCRERSSKERRETSISTVGALSISVKRIKRWVDKPLSEQGTVSKKAVLGSKGGGKRSTRGRCELVSRRSGQAFTPGLRGAREVPMRGDFRADSKKTHKEGRTRGATPSKALCGFPRWKECENTPKKLKIAI